MAHLWITGADGWAVLPLVRDAYLLDAHPPSPALAPGATELAPIASDRRPLQSPRTVLMSAGSATRHGWILLTADSHVTRINGLPALAGIRMLADRDEIAVSGQPPMFFSTEALAQVVPFSGAVPPLFCPRCKQGIDGGMPAVRCPRCDVWHHQTDDLPCWTYAATCAICDCRTALDAGFTWVPEER